MSGQAVTYPKESLALLKNFCRFFADFFRPSPYNSPAKLTRSSPPFARSLTPRRSVRRWSFKTPQLAMTTPRIVVPTGLS